LVYQDPSLTRNDDRNRDRSSDLDEWGKRICCGVKRDVITTCIIFECQEKAVRVFKSESLINSQPEVLRRADTSVKCAIGFNPTTATLYSERRVRESCCKVS
jgi:hypothetical protein